MGFFTKNVPVGHPDFGKAFPCTCQQNSITARRNAQLRALSNLDALVDKTFDTFEANRSDLTGPQRDALRRSFSIAQTYALAPAGWLMLEGSYGSGKTHLAAAIANEQLDRGNQVMFVTTPDLLDHLRATFGPSSEIAYDELFEQVRNISLLVLDDLGTESPTAWAQEKLYQVINHRYVQQLCTVVTTNTDVGTLDPRIRSRLLDENLGQIIHMHLPDFRRKKPKTEPDDLSELGAYENMIFDTFDTDRPGTTADERRNLFDAFTLAHQFAEKPEGWLLLLGVHGCGKTHLAAAIANHQHRRGNTIALVTTADLLDHLRAAFSDPVTTSFNKRFNELKEAPLLIIDQFDLNGASAWAMEKMRQIINHRYLTRRPTVFTSAQELESFDPLIKSRLSDTRFCTIFAIKASDYMGGAQPNRRR
ncbi:MAG: ATP-binding protein [Anaerolineae bacterium]|nr:ATP-binding protein [Anaerolineae bacterium]